jgi:DNA-binding CsgD family transcriptional regulator
MSSGADDPHHLQDKTLSAADAAELLRLSNLLHRHPSHPAARKQQLLDGLAKLIGAAAGACVVAHQTGDGKPAAVSITFSTSSARKRIDRRRNLVQEKRVESHPLVEQIHRRLRAPDRGGDAQTTDRTILCSVVRLDRPRTSAGLALGRRAGDRRPFTQRDEMLVSLFHREMRWIYQFDLPLMSPEVAPLSPRMRQTLQFLLAGASEREIAAHLGLSLNTVHHYVKQLYKHFEVSSRSQLLARWVGE